jgi:FkbH-like protein
MPDLPTPPDVAIAIVATFTAEPLLPALQFSLRQAGLVLDIRFAPYHQVFQELLSSTSLLATNMGGVDVVLVRLEDFVRSVDNVEEARTIIERTTRDLSDALNQHARRVRMPTVLAVLPPSPSAQPALAPELQAASADLVAHARRLPGITLLLPEDLDLVLTGERYDSVADELGHMPFTEEYYASLALAIARKVHALRVPALKVLVLDCDETLWRGVVGEDGVDGITIPPPLARVQQFARDVQEKGVLVCLVSKNMEDDVLKVFERRSDMVLKLEHIVAHRINWQSKPSNVASLARTLNLGLDSFVFIDDNPVECALMEAELPQVVTLQLPPDNNEIESFLSRLWMFDKINVTDEDARRTSMYRENAARQQLEERTTDIAKFMASLEVVVDIAQPADNEWPRVAQLTHRTNQFNFTTVRRSESEMRGVAEYGSTVLRITVRDRFGAYGLVGVVIVNAGTESLVVDTFLLSCRVLGRGVEHAILRRLGEIARERHLTYVDLPYLPTFKNEPAHAFVESVAASFRTLERDRIIYRIPVDAALAIAHRPGHDPAAVIEARKAEENKGATLSSALTTPIANQTRSQRYACLARTLLSGRDVLRAARARDARARTLSGEPTKPATDTERKLLALWQEQLRIDGLGVEDDYFAIGGTSLAAARLFAEIARQFGVKLRLTAILEARTVRALSRQLEQQETPRSAALIELKRGGPRYFFLVHDGDGETLLYLNLARRMPGDLTVLGIEPRRIAGVPLAHTRIEDMAVCYINEIRKRQPHGPYLLGGMCAGGVIAYEIARQLSDARENIKLVALLDAATPQATIRIGRLTKKRIERLTQAVADAHGTGRPTISRGLFIASAISWKLVSALVWELTRYGKQLSVRARFRLLRELLERRRPWPAFVPPLSVRQIYDSAEHLYTPKPLSGPSIVLLRACAGEANDTPYREIYADQMFGWGSLTKSLTIVDVDGGHSSMLQEPFVESLADALRTHLIHDSQSSCASFINGSDVEKSVPFADAQRQFADAQPENAA